jgi:cell fate regulator YaaT (PSP1 superfamily)
VGVKLRFAPKTLWFDPSGSSPAEGDTVVVETERGTELGNVVQPPHEVAASDLPAPLKPVVRVAGEDDLRLATELAEKEREALPVFRALISEQGLDMKPVDVEYLFGGDKVIFYFSAEERVDFRELVRELATRFRVRIDMRQVGVRDEARMIGGLGHCGEQLCCVRLGGEFQPVSIRMAKEQDLPLNPLKISGLCGRLMCCLRYEYDAYKDFKTRAPKRGAMVETPVGAGKVSDLNTPKETVTVRLEDGSNFTVPLASMGCSKGTGCPCSVNQEALDAVRPVSALLAGADSSAGLGTEQSARRKSSRRETQAPQSQPRGGGKGRGGKKPAATAKGPSAAAPQAGSTEADGTGQAAQPVPGRRRRRRRSPGGGGAKPDGQ